MMIPYHKYKAYYESPTIKFKMLPYVKNREFAMLVSKGQPYTERSIRFMKITRAQSFDFFYSVTGMFEQQTLYNFYGSVADYHNGLPLTPFSIDTRRAAANAWKTEHTQQMRGYDFFLDIDGEYQDFDYVKTSAIEVYDFFTKYNVPFYLRFSGAGFHYVVPYSYWHKLPVKYLSKNIDSSVNIYNSFAALAKYLYRNVTEMIDSSIYDARRIIKIPYSLAVYPDRVQVCYPINSRDELIRFDIDACIPGLIPISEIYAKSERLHNRAGNADEMIKIIQKEVEKNAEAINARG